MVFCALAVEAKAAENTNAGKIAKSLFIQLMIIVYAKEDERKQQSNITSPLKLTRAYCLINSRIDMKIDHCLTKVFIVTLCFASKIREIF